MAEENKQIMAQEQLSKASFSSLEMNVFKNNPKSFYIYKKTEKLVAAIYLVSGLISDSEPMKRELREAGARLLSKGLFMSDSSSNLVLNEESLSLEMVRSISLLEIAYLGKVVSEMNYLILRREMEDFLKVLQSSVENKSRGSVVFPDNFFEVPVKDISNVSFKVSDRKTEPVNPRPKVTLKDKPNRQEIILNLLKKNKELTIKDFSRAISNCSEKTIQRELVAMVFSGLLKRQGEKRWSRYSLK